MEMPDSAASIFPACNAEINWVNAMGFNV